MKKTHLLITLVTWAAPLAAYAAGCDLNNDSSTNVNDVQLCANQAIGATPCSTGDIDGNSQCNVIDVQRVVNAALGGQCVTPSDNGLGNLWVDTNGGTCTRQTTASPWVDAQGCSSLNAAYAAAGCGDTIRIKAGTYSTSQQINETAAGTACAGNPIVFRGEAGQRPTFQHIRLGDFVGNCASNGPDNITLVGLDVTWGIDIEQDSNHIVIDDFKGGSFGLGGGICGAPNNVPPNDVTVKNSEWGPCRSGGGTGFDCRNQYTDAPDEGKNKISDGVSNVLIENNVIHDFEITNASHFECIWVGGGNNVTIQRNHFYNCVTNAIAMPDGPDIQGSWLIQNNWFGDPGSVNAAMKFGALSAPPSGTVLVRFNSFGPGSGGGNEVNGDTQGRVSWIGNIFGENYNCMQNAVYAYNLYLNNAGCGPNDRSVGALPYVNTSGMAAGNYHLTGTTLADGYVPASVANSGLATDYDGEARSGPRDAGSDER